MPLSYGWFTAMPKLHGSNLHVDRGRSTPARDRPS